MSQRLSSLAFLILLCGVGSGVWAQTISVSGTVVEGEIPLPGVSVLVKGTYNGTVTDLNGAFALTVESGSTLEFSFIGYLRKELEVSQTVSDLKVNLQPDVAGLEEAVVIGYETNNGARSLVR